MSARFDMRFGLLGCLVALSLALAPSVARADDEDDETPAGKPAAPTPAAPTPATPAPATPAKPAAPAAPAPAAPAPAATSDVPAAAPAAPAAQPAPEAPDFKLVGGAPLGDPDVNVHIVERKPLSDYRRHEVVLFPAVAQVNGKFTNHLGLAAEYLYHFQENVAFQVTPMFFYVNGESGFNEDLVNIARLQAQAATALTMLYGAEAGVETTPIYGKFAFYETKMASFALVLNAGIGAASTRVQLRPSTADSAATYGDTGFKFLGNVGGGFRVKLGEHWAIRLEVRDLVYTAKVDTVNGCNEEDLVAIQGGGDPSSASCKPDKFTYADDGSQPDVPLAKALLKVPSSDVLNQVEFFGGVAYVF